MRDGDWKLISVTTRGQEKSVLSLHTLAGDNPEAVDHFEKQPEIVARLRELHESWLRVVTPRK